PDTGRPVKFMLPPVPPLGTPATVWMISNDPNHKLQQERTRHGEDQFRLEAEHGAAGGPRGPAGQVPNRERRPPVDAELFRPLAAARAPSVGRQPPQHLRGLHVGGSRAPSSTAGTTAPH